jgi:hypothetical protein
MKGDPHSNSSMLVGIALRKGSRKKRGPLRGLRKRSQSHRPLALEYHLVRIE